MCSGTLPNPRNWNRELHDIAGCDHDSPTARRLDSFLNDFVMFRHYNRPAEPVETHPLKAFTVTRRVAAEWNEGDCCNECGGSLHVDGHTETCSRRASFLPLGCHNPIAHVNLLCADVVPCKFKFYTRPGYCTGFWVTRDGRQIHHYDNKTDAEAQRDFLNAKSVFPDAPPPAASVRRILAAVKPCGLRHSTVEPCLGFWVERDGNWLEHFENEVDANARRDQLNNAPLFAAEPFIEPADNRHIYIDFQSCRIDPKQMVETDGTDGKTAADCFAKGGYLTGQPQTTFGGFPVAPPIDLPPVELKPRVRGLASLRRSWRVR